MAQRVGDLYPHASGTSSLGVEQINGPAAGHTTDVRPFNHVHMNSGVWHDPLHGTSGVFRYDNDRGMEFSNDGGITFSSLGVGSVTDLQDAYDGGNEIDVDGQAPPAGFGFSPTNLSVSQTPVTVKVVTPGGGVGSGGGEEEAREGAIIVASGFTLTPEIRNTYHETGIGPGFFYIQGSGVVGGGKPGYFSVVGGGGGGLANDFITMNTSGTFICASAGSMTFNVNQDDNLVFNGLNFTNNGSTNGIGGQITFSPFANSGKLQYRFGPYQSWWMRTSHSTSNGPDGDGYHPLVPSGNILQMILENGGGGGGVSNLQEAYEGGNSIVTASADGPVTIEGNTEDALQLSSLVNSALNLSGVFAPGAGKVNEGDIWFARHQLKPEHPDLVDLVDQNALGLAGGTPTLFLHGGQSGVINLRTGSGIAQFFNLVNTDYDENGVYVRFVNGGQIAVDKHFRASVNSGIQILAEGCYLATYSASVQQTAGNLAIGSEANIHVGGKQGQLWRIAGGRSFCETRDSQGRSENTANGQAVMDLFAGEFVRLRVEQNEAVPAPNQMRIRSQGSSMILQFIGPVRGTSAQRSPISPIFE